MPADPRSLSSAAPERVFLSLLPPARSERVLALVVVAVSVVAFLAAAPFAQVPLAPVAGFIPIYQSALAINDLITAALLFGQFSILRSRARSWRSPAATCSRR
jgi:hypothetical protein